MFIFYLEMYEKLIYEYEDVPDCLKGTEILVKRLYQDIVKA